MMDDKKYVMVEGYPVDKINIIFIDKDMKQSFGRYKRIKERKSIWDIFRKSEI